MKTIYKTFYLLLMKSSILVGGQAVIEGVMMRVPGAYATSVRLANGEIETERHAFCSIIEKYKLEKIYFLRGMIHLYESMKMGYATLDWSAQLHEEKTEQKKNKLLDLLMTIFSIFFALSLFVLLPLYSTSYFFNDTINYPLSFNLISGFIRVFIFLSYLILISRLKDVKTLFEYHGAEHKTVYNFESGEKINIDNAKTYSTLHPRCGTSFVFILMLVTIFTYTIIDSIALLFIDELTYIYRMGFHILCLPLVSGIGYEVLKFLAKYQKNIFCRTLSKPGMWLQKITTNEPNDKQLEIAIHALKTALGKDFQKYQGKKFVADAIG